MPIDCYPDIQDEISEGGGTPSDFVRSWSGASHRRGIQSRDAETGG
jgi:hypothetical protein